MREVKLGDREGTGGLVSTPTTTMSQASEHLVVLKTRDCVGPWAGKQREGSRGRQVRLTQVLLLLTKHLRRPTSRPCLRYLVSSFLP